MTYHDRLRHLRRERRAIDRGLVQEQVTDGEWIMRSADLARLRAAAERDQRQAARRRAPSFQWWR